MTTATEDYNDVFSNEYFQLSRQLLIGIGQWPYERRLKKYICRFIALGALLNSVPFVVKEFNNRWATSKNTSMHCIPPLLTQFACLMKFANFSVNETRMRTLLYNTYENWKKITEGEEQKILLAYGEYAKSMSRLYAGCLYIAMVFFLLMPTAPSVLDVIFPLNESRPKHLVFPTDYGVPPEDYYVLLMIHAYIGTFAAITIIVACDVFFICLICHACSLFAIVKNCFEHMDDGIMDHTTQGSRISKYRDPVVTNIFVKRVAYAVFCHNKALKYSELVENSFTWTLFILLGINMIIISLTGFQVLTQKDRWDDVLTCVTYIFGQLCHLFLLSLPGQLLVDESGSVRECLRGQKYYWLTWLPDVCHVKIQRIVDVSQMLQFASSGLGGSDTEAPLTQEQAKANALESP